MRAQQRICTFLTKTMMAPGEGSRMCRRTFVLYVAKHISPRARIGSFLIFSLWNGLTARRNIYINFHPWQKVSQLLERKSTIFFCDNVKWQTDGNCKYPPSRRVIKSPATGFYLLLDTTNILTQNYTKCKVKVRNLVITKCIFRDDPGMIILRFNLFAIYNKTPMHPINTQHPRMNIFCMTGRTVTRKIGKCPTSLSMKC